MSDRFDFAVIASIPEADLRQQFEALQRDGYRESWDDYLEEQEHLFLDYASGWWMRESIGWRVKRSQA